MSNSGITTAASIGERELPIDKTDVVLTHKQAPTNWVSSRMLQPSTEQAITNYSVPLDFLVKSQVSELGTVHPFTLLEHTVSSSLQEEDGANCNGWTQED